MVDKLDFNKIKEELNSNIKAYVLESVDSTNTFSKMIIDSEDKQSFIVVSEEQTNGRGRLGRSFYSPKHNGVYLSFCYKLKELNESVATITTLTACVVTKIIEELIKKELKIKWVNDIYFNDKKVCGILTESKIKDDQCYIIIGIGINVFENSFPKELEDIAIALNEDNVSRNKLIVNISNELYNYLSNDYYLQEKVKKEYIDFYRSHSNVIGKNIIYYVDGYKKNGIAIDVNDKGELIVLNEDKKEDILRTGEITIRVVK